MHRALNSYRDKVMLKKILKAVGKNRRVFALVGRSHVVMQELVLWTELGPKPDD